ncbi:SRPBCC domain-containing protein [Corynebacterium efficiens]|nr:SRPBCC domain-containing protein [Corynebacterium efficiens]
MPFPALLIPLIFWAGVAAFSSWAVSRALPLSATRTVRINASVDEVWDLVTDLGRASEWNDHIVHSSAPEGLEEGRKLRMHTHHPETSRLRASFRPTLTVLEPQTEMTWEAKIIARWVLSVTDTIRLSRVEDNLTEVTQTMTFSGMLSPGVPFLTSIEHLQDTSNAKLKALLEQH